MLKSNGIITDLQREILLIFSMTPDCDMFYLTGGTALTEFYLAHRKSFDLDIFTTEKALVIPFSHALEDEIKKVFQVKVIRRSETFVEFEVSGKGESLKNPLTLISV